MIKDLAKKIVIGGMIVGAGLSLNSCQKYEVNGNKVKYNLLFDNITEYNGKDKIKYFVSPDNINSMTSVVVNGHKYTEGIVYDEAEKRFRAIKNEIESRKKIKKSERNKGHTEEDLWVIRK